MSFWNRKSNRPEQDEQLLSQLREGRLTAAELRWVNLTGCNLADAREAVAELKRRLDAGVEPEDMPPVHIGSPAEESSDDVDADPEVLELLRGGKKIGAIKRRRELTGESLAAAKAAVERLPLDSSPEPVQSVGSPRDQLLADKEFQKYLGYGMKLPAVKRARDVLGFSLKEAKELTDDIFANG